MARPNYQFEKRNREMAQKKKKEEKRLRKLAAKEAQPATGATPPAVSEGSAEGQALVSN